MDCYQIENWSLAHTARLLTLGATFLLAIGCHTAEAVKQDTKSALDATGAGLQKGAAKIDDSKQDDSKKNAATVKTTGTTTTPAKEVMAAPSDVTRHRATPAAVDNPPAADETNTASNTKASDRSGGLTAMDQGSSGTETKITAAIRRGMMADKALSFTAKNVKVITVGTKVTLRGPVKSDREKSSIEALARQTAGVSEVDNQLEVKN
jgi:osmotically-inducible protein OsmY